MTSKSVSQLLSNLNITRSHSRPHVSNDNPYSEAQFKTLKYCPAFPGSFTTLEEARAFCDIFFAYHNNEHRYPGIGLRTPVSVHDGTAWAIPSAASRSSTTRTQRIREVHAPPASPGPAAQGMDQPASTDHPDPGGHTDNSSRLMPQTV